METTRRAPAAAPPDARGNGGSTVTDRSGPSPAVRVTLIVLGAIVLLVALIYGIRFLAYATTHETTDDAMIDADVVQVTPKISERVDAILTDTNRYVRRGQLLVLLEDSDERDRYGQALAAYHAQEEQARAAEANVLLTRDTQEAQNLQNEGSIAQAQAGISGASAQTLSAQQQIAVTQSGEDAARAELKAAQDAVPGALQNLRKAAADLARTQSLVSTGDVARQQLDADQASYEGARSQYAQALANIAAAQAEFEQALQKVNSQRFSTESTQTQIGQSQGELTTARGHYQESAAPSRVPYSQAQADAAFAQAASLRADLLTASDNLSYTRIHSPIDGYVGEKDVEIGQTVSPGEVLLTLIPSNNVYVTANYKETQIGHMHKGQEVDINIDAYKGVKFVGHVENLGPASQNTFSLVPAQNATGNFVKVTQRVPIRIVFDNPDPNYPLRTGMSVETSVKVK